MNWNDYVPCSNCLSIYSFTHMWQKNGNLLFLCTCQCELHSNLHKDCVCWFFRIISSNMFVSDFFKRIFYIEIILEVQKRWRYGGDYIEYGCIKNSTNPSSLMCLICQHFQTTPWSHLAYKDHIHKVRKVKMWPIFKSCEEAHSSTNYNETLSKSL